MRVLRVGYQEQKKSATVAPGQSATLDFTLETAIVKLNEIVTTATGEQRRVELGNSVSSIDAASRAHASPTTNMASMLVGQAPGVQVLPGRRLDLGSAEIDPQPDHAISLACLWKSSRN